MPLKLFLITLGCKPNGRHTEQHDVFFGIGYSLKDLLPEMKKFWPGVKLHIDSWKEVTVADGHLVKIAAKEENISRNENKLFFLNLGGYKPNDLEEYHYKLLCVAKEKGDAIKQAKQTAFYTHTGFKGAASHIDDKYGIDVDDVYEIADILPRKLKDKYFIIVEKGLQPLAEDELHIGYLKLSSL